MKMSHAVVIALTLATGSVFAAETAAPAAVAPAAQAAPAKEAAKPAKHHKRQHKAAPKKVEAVKDEAKAGAAQAK